MIGQNGSQPLCAMMLTNPIWTPLSIVSAKFTKPSWTPLTFPLAKLIAPISHMPDWRPFMSPAKFKGPSCHPRKDVREMFSSPSCRPPNESA